MQLNKSFVIAFRQFHILKIPIEACFSANFVHRFAVTVFQFRCIFRGQRSRKQPAPQAPDSESRRLFRREHQEFNRMFGPESAPLQCANGFESAKHSDNAVIFAGVGNCINVRSRANGRCRSIGPGPPSKNISDRVLPHREPGLFAQRNHPRARFQIRGSKNNSRDRRWLRV